MTQSGAQARAIDPKVRDAAVEAARRFGIPLGGWLSHAATHGEGGGDLLAEPEDGGAESSLGPEQTRRIAVALERLAQRVEFNERRASLLMSDVDRSVADLSVRLQETEVGARENSLRVIAALGEVKSLQAALTERLARVEQEPAAERALGALRDIDRRIDQALRDTSEVRAEGVRRDEALEARLASALSELRRSVTSVEGRLAVAEAAAKEARAAAAEAIAPLGARVEALEHTSSAAIQRLETRIEEVDTQVANAFATLGASVERALKKAGVGLASLDAVSKEEFKQAIEALERRLAEADDHRVEAAQLRAALAAQQARIAHLEQDKSEAIAALSERLEAAEQRTLATAETVASEIRRLSEAVDGGFAALQAQSGDEGQMRLAQFEERADTLQREFSAKLAALESRAGARIGDAITHLTQRLGETDSRSDAALDLLARRLAQSEERAEQTQADLRRALEETARRTEELHALLDGLQSRTPAAAPIELEPVVTQRFESEPAPEPGATSTEPSEPPPEHTAAEIDHGALEPLAGAPEDPADPDVPLAAVAEEPELGGAPPTEDEPPKRTVSLSAPPAHWGEDAGDIEQALSSPWISDLPLGRTSHNASATERPSSAAPQAAQSVNDALPETDPDDPFWAIDPEPEPRAAAFDPPLRSEAKPHAGAAEPSASGASYLEQARRAAISTAAGAKPKRSAADTIASPGRGGAALAMLIGAGAAAAMAGGAWVLLRDRPTPPAPAAPASPATSRADSALHSAAENGDTAAQFALARERLDAGDAGAAANLLRRAATRGYAPAQFELGRLYERGEGVERDLNAARSLMERAAAAGNRDAMHALGVYFARGEGAPLDEAAAFRWFRQAAELGVVDSQFNLGVMYQQGRGAPANPDEALFWFLTAAAGGDQQAAQVAERLKAEFPSEQLARIEARVARFTPRPADPAANAPPPAPSRG